MDRGNWYQEMERFPTKLKQLLHAKLGCRHPYGPAVMPPTAQESRSGSVVVAHREPVVLEVVQEPLEAP